MKIDAHLHPQWQRRHPSPAMKEALPNVQIIVTTHSPFVINSYSGARVHVLELNREGIATARPPVDAPFGETLTSTIKDIFDVPDRVRYDRGGRLRYVGTIWSRRKSTGRIDEAEEKELVKLSEQLASRSEELKALVGPYLRARNGHTEPVLSGQSKSRKR